MCIANTFVCLIRSNSSYSRNKENEENKFRWTTFYNFTLQLETTFKLFALCFVREIHWNNKRKEIILVKMADLEAVLADVSYLMAMEKSKCTPAARASKKIILPDPRWVKIFFVIQFSFQHHIRYIYMISTIHSLLSLHFLYRKYLQIGYYDYEWAALILWWLRGQNRWYHWIHA